PLPHKRRAEDDGPLATNRFFSRHIRWCQECFKHSQGCDNRLWATTCGTPQNKPFDPFWIMQDNSLAIIPPMETAKTCARLMPGAVTTLRHRPPSSGWYRPYSAYHSAPCPDYQR